jgi:hypothetical protein
MGRDLREIGVSGSIRIGHTALLKINETAVVLGRSNHNPDLQNTDLEQHYTPKRNIQESVADPGCYSGSRTLILKFFILDPGFGSLPFSFRIPDPTGTYIIRD